MNRREFVQALAIAAAAGLRLTDAHADTFSYDVPRFGNVHLLHFTDCHAQLLPIEYREPSVNLGAVSYTHLTLPTIVEWCRSRWSPYH